MDPESGADALARMLDEDPTMDAVFSGNDQMALGAMHVMHARGISIPDQMAIVGFDGRGGGVVHPPLTTIRQPLGELGQMAVREVLAINADDPGQRPVRSLTLATELIVRGVRQPWRWQMRREPRYRADLPVPDPDGVFGRGGRDGS